MKKASEKRLSNHRRDNRIRTWDPLLPKQVRYPDCATSRNEIVRIGVLRFRGAKIYSFFILRKKRDEKKPAPKGKPYGNTTSTYTA